MLTRQIPRATESLPVIGIGSYQTFDVDMSDRALATPKTVLAQFLAKGGRLIDTSPMYGEAEAAIGRALGASARPSDLFVATKVWTSGREAGIRQMTDSMRKLGCQRIDLMQVHNLLDVDTHLKTLRDWREQGKIRYIGVTHYTASAHAAVAKALTAYDVDFMQINYSLVEREAEKLLLPLAADRGIAVIVNRPFAGGALLRSLNKVPVPAEAAELQCATWSQLALKFILGHAAVTCVIPATSSPTHLNEFMVAGTGPLPDNGMRARIAAAAQVR